MALKPLNSVGGFSVGETPSNVIYPNGYITGSGATFSGNLLISNSNASWGVLTDNLYYSNGVPWDLQAAAGANYEIQYNISNNFAASPNFTFNPSTNVLEVVGNIIGTNANLGNLVTANYVNVANQVNGNVANFSGNLTSLNASLGNLATANFVNVASNTITSNLTVNLELAGNTANFSGNVITPNLTVNLELAGNTANFIGNINALNANLGNLGRANFISVNSNVITNNATVNLEFVGNTANFSGNVILPNLTVNTTLVGNVANFSGNLTAANANLGNLATANFVNVSSNVNVTNTMQAGNVRTDNLLYANGTPWDFQEAAGSNTQIQYNMGNNFAASANFTYNDATQQFTVLGNGQFNNANLGNLATANFINVASNVLTSNLTVNLELAGNTANFSGNVVVPNLTVNTTLQGNVANFSGNVIVPNLTVNTTLQGNVANFSGNLTSLNANLGNVATANYVNVASNLTVNGELSGNTANFSGNVIVPNLTVNLQLNGNTANFTGNVVAPNLIGALANGNSNVKVYGNANIEISIGGVANIATFNGNQLYVVGNIESTAGNVLANGNVIANGTVNGANANITGQGLFGSVRTANINAPTGNLTISAAGVDENIYILPSGNGVVDFGLHRITELGDPTQPHDAATKEYVDNIAQGLSIHSPVRVTSTTNLNATYADGGTALTTTTIAGGKTITFSTNHGLLVGDEIYWTSSFNGIISNDAYFVYSTPALNQITVKAGFYGAEVTTLTNGTGLTQPARGNPGVGATLTNAGANVALSIDSVALSTTNRVLVQGQTNAFENGVYTVTTVGNGSTAWVLTRATTEDQYDPKSTSGLGYGDYFFVQQGTNAAGSSYVLTTPTGEIVFGVTNILFSQFSASGSYTAGNGIAITGTIISANIDGVTTDIVGGNIVVKSSANLTTPNIGDATFQSITWNNAGNGNVTANNLSIGNIANIGGNLTVSANLQVSYDIDSNANIYSNNSDVTNFLTVGSNITGNNITSNNLITTTNANISSNLITSNATVNLELAGNTANFSGNVVMNNATVNLELAGNTANFSGNVILPNLTVNLELAGNTANFSGTVVVPNLTVNNNIAGNTANFTGNISAANANLGNLATANFFTGTLINGTSNVAIPTTNGNVNITAGGNTSLVVTATGGNIVGNLNVSSTLFANVANVSNSIVLGNTAVYWGTVTTSAITGNQTIATIPTAGVTGYEFIVKGVDSTGSKYSVATVTAVTNGTTVDYVTFATAALGGATGVLAVNVVGGNIALQVTPSSSNSTVWTTQFRTI